MNYNLKALLTIILFLSVSVGFAQSPDSLTTPNNNYTDSLIKDSTDMRARNHYGDLMNDDPGFNKRYSIGSTAFGIFKTNAFSWAVSRYVFNFEWAHTSLDTWKHNLSAKWEWDSDRFGVNFIGHPNSGSSYFNVARSNGYSFWACLPFAIGGSFMWEYFGENTAPSRNDLINTPVSGAFLGEIIYRISSNILDDRKRGSERFFRELLAGIINPSRAFSRFTQGKMFRVVGTQVYQQEPMNITLSGGVHKVNDNNKFGSGSTNAILNLQLDYGDPFEIRRRKPYDVFRFRFESRYGDDKKFIDNVLGYGLLYGKNISYGPHYNLLLGVFQHFDYWNNKIFELGSLGFGPGVLFRLNTKKTIQFYSSLHMAAVPISGYGTRNAPDTSEFRDYPFGGGIEGRIEERLNIWRLSLSLNGYYYWIWNYEGSEGKTRIGIIKPAICFRVYKNFSLGFEHHVYYDRRYLDDHSPAFRVTRTEQKFFMQLFFEDRRRKGNYQ